MQFAEQAVQQKLGHHAMNDDGAALIYFFNKKMCPTQKFQ